MIVHVLRKPVVGTVAQNALQHGCGALNIEGCRIVTSDNLNGGTYSGKMRNPLPGDERTGKSAGRFGVDGTLSPEDYTQPTGRWPANLVFDDRAAATLDAQTGTLTSGVPDKRSKPYQTTSGPTMRMLDRDEVGYGNTGGASRFFQQVEVK